MRLPFDIFECSRRHQQKRSNTHVVLPLCGTGLHVCPFGCPLDRSQPEDKVEANKFRFQSASATFPVHERTSWLRADAMAPQVLFNMLRWGRLGFRFCVCHARTRCMTICIDTKWRQVTADRLSPIRPSWLGRGRQSAQGSMAGMGVGIGRVYQPHASSSGIWVRTAASTDQSPLQCGHSKRDHCGHSGSPWRRAIGVYWFSEQCSRA